MSLSILQSMAKTVELCPIELVPLNLMIIVYLDESNKVENLEIVDRAAPGHMRFEPKGYRASYGLVEKIEDAVVGAVKELEHKFMNVKRTLDESWFRFLHVLSEHIAVIRKKFQGMLFYLPEETTDDQVSARLVNGCRDHVDEYDLLSLSAEETGVDFCMLRWESSKSPESWDVYVEAHDFASGTYPPPLEIVDMIKVEGAARKFRVIDLAPLRWYKITIQGGNCSESVVTITKKQI